MKNIYFTMFLIWVGGFLLGFSGRGIYDTAFHSGKFEITGTAFRIHKGGVVKVTGKDLDIRFSGIGFLGTSDAAKKVLAEMDKLPKKNIPDFNGKGNYSWHEKEGVKV